MTDYSPTSRDEEVAHIVRKIGRLAQMLEELRDEYVTQPRKDTVAQIEQRLDDLIALREPLREAASPAPLDEGP